MALPDRWTVKHVVAMTYIKGLTYNSIKKIVEKYKSFQKFYANSLNEPLASNVSQETLFSNIVKESLLQAESQMELCEKNKIQIVTLWDENYPSLLKQITGPPVILFVKGILQPPDRTSISIVGTRKNTLYGKLTTEKYSEYFAKNSLIVTSGMAYGTDTIAHTSAIEASGITYAIIASGIDCIGIGSAVAERTSKRILESGGAIISEYRCGIKALPAYFPQRNRIISGISIATLVIESGEKGGSLITARFAFDQNRDVFAVPGNLNSEKSFGTNRLVQKDIARITITPSDILETLGIETKQNLFTIKIGRAHV